MICNECLRGFLCGECELPTTTEEASNDDDAHMESQLGSNRTRSFKRDAALRDQQSTGRKRAARAYPLFRDQPCEWRTKTRCGGGTAPIKGCDDGTQQARHHGPDKSTLNNDEGNVWRICNGCHARWHVANDADYIPGKPLRD